MIDHLTREDLARIANFPHRAREHEIRTMAEHLLRQGRRIDTAEELEALPGRSIVLGHHSTPPMTWQLTSHDEYGANWGSPYLPMKRFTSRQILAREGSVTVLYIPEVTDHA